MKLFEALFFAFGVLIGSLLMATYAQAKVSQSSALLDDKPKVLECKYLAKEPNTLQGPGKELAKENFSLKLVKDIVDGEDIGWKGEFSSATKFSSKTQLYASVSESVIEFVSVSDTGSKISAYNQTPGPYSTTGLMMQSPTPLEHRLSCSVR